MVYTLFRTQKITGWNIYLGRFNGSMLFNVYLESLAGEGKSRSTIWIKLDWRDLGISVSLDRKRYSFIKGVPYDWQIFG